jgi:hypothetical protein
VTFEEWYAVISPSLGTTSPRDLARAAFVAGKAVTRTDLEAHFADRVSEMRAPPVITAEMHMGLRESPRDALHAWTRGVMRSVVREIGEHEVGG